MAGEPWPFVFLMPDNVVMWQVCGKENATDRYKIMRLSSYESFCEIFRVGNGFQKSCF